SKLKDVCIIPSLLPSSNKDVKEIQNDWKRLSQDKEVLGRSYFMSLIPFGLFSKLFIQFMTQMSPAVKFVGSTLLLGKHDGYVKVELIPESNKCGIIKIHCIGDD